jgi:hypothetical protein
MMTTAPTEAPTTTPILLPEPSLATATKGNINEYTNANFKLQTIVR